MVNSWKFMSNIKHVNWFFFNMNFHELAMRSALVTLCLQRINHEFFINGKNKLYVQLILNRYLRKYYVFGALQKYPDDDFVLSGGFF